MEPLMPARKIVHHEPVTPAKGQTWHGYDDGPDWDIVKLKGKTHIEVADLRHPTARHKILTRGGFLSAFRSGAEVWLPVGDRKSVV